MGMGFASTWLRQVSPPASQNHFNHCLQRVVNKQMSTTRCKEYYYAL